MRFFISQIHDHTFKTLLIWHTALAKVSPVEADTNTIQTLFMQNARDIITKNVTDVAARIRKNEWKPMNKCVYPVSRSHWAGKKDTQITTRSHRRRATVHTDSNERDGRPSCQHREMKPSAGKMNPLQGERIKRKVLDLQGLFRSGGYMESRPCGSCGCHTSRAGW